jgi:hypothetical protein
MQMRSAGRVLLTNPQQQIDEDDLARSTVRKSGLVRAGHRTSWLAANYEDALGSGGAALELPATRFIVGEMGPPVTLT